MQTLKHVVLSLLAINFCLKAAKAAERTWTGADTDSLWSSAANWSVGVPVNGDSLKFAGYARLYSTNNLTVDTEIAGLTFAAYAAPFTLSGNRITLTGNVVNQSSATQTISLPLLISGANRDINTANGSIKVTSALNYPGTSALNYIKRGTNELIFTGTSINSNSNNRFSLVEGTLRFATNSRFHLVETNAAPVRDLFRVGNEQDKKSALIIEPGAEVALGCISVQMSAKDTGTSTFDMLVNGGRLILAANDYSFGDQTGNNITLNVINGGAITTISSNSWFNVGTRCPMSITIDDGSVQLGQFSFGRESNAADRKNGFGGLNLKKGELYIMQEMQLMSTSWAGRTNIVTLGNGTPGSAKFSVRAIKRASNSGHVAINLNGAIFEIRSATSNLFGSPNEVNMLRGGITIDTQSFTVDVTDKVFRDPNLPLTTRDGGLTKRGSGTLNFKNYDLQFNGPLRVEDGTLRISSAMLADLEEIYLTPGKSLSLRGSFKQNLVPERLTLGAPDIASTLVFDVSTDDMSCDSIHIPVGGYVGKLNIYLRERAASDIDFTLPGSFPIFTYASEPPDITLLTHANCPLGMTSNFTINRNTKTVYLNLTHSDTYYKWINPIGGAWATGGNWVPGIPANSHASQIAFVTELTNPANVTIDTQAICGQITFNSANAYNLSGSGSLALPAAATIESSKGSHTVQLPITLQSDLTISAPANQTLAFNNTLSGSGTIIKRGSGTLQLNGNNDFVGGVNIQIGTVAIANAAALGTGNVTLGGGALNFTDNGALTNNITQISSSAINMGTNTFVSSGELLLQGGTLTKQGSGELHLAGSGNSSSAGVRFNFREGTTRLKNGANYTILGGTRDDLMTSYSANGQTSTLIIESGAELTTSGMRLLAEGSIGTSTVHVAGGKLNLLNAEATIVNANTKGSGMGRILVTDGGQLWHGPAQWFNLGVYSLGTLAITNGIFSTDYFTAAGYGYTVGSGGRKGSAEITVGPGGFFEVRSYFTWLTDNQNLTATLRLAGGRLSIPATGRSTGSTGTATVILDGGTFDCLGAAGFKAPDILVQPSLTNYLYGVDQLWLGTGGVTFDTRQNSVTIKNSLTMAPNTSTATALIKQGSGRLELAGNNNFNAPVTVQEGALALPQLPNNSVTVAAGAMLETAGSSVTDASFANNATLGITPGAAITVSGTLTLGTLINVNLKGAVVAGTTTLFNYNTLNGDANTLCVINPDSGFKYSFNDTGSAIELVISANADSARWDVDANGQWGINSNWDTQVAPDGLGHAAAFTRTFAQPRTITLDSAVALGALLFDTANAPTIGGAYTLTLNNYPGVAAISARAGTPTINSAMDLPGTTRVTIEPSATLNVAGSVGGNGSMLIEGGKLALSGTNAVADTRVQNGGVLTLRQGGKQAAALSVSDGSLVADASITLSESVSFGPLNARLATESGKTLTLAGAVTGNGNLTKIGRGTVKLENSLAWQGSTAIEAGTLAFDSAPQAGLTLGAGTFAYTGALEANLPGYIINTGSNLLAATIHNNAALNVTGAVNTINGTFIKRGSGELRFTATGFNKLAAGATSNNEYQILDQDADGNAPTQGFMAFNIFDGTVILGAPNQVNQINGRTRVGGYTTDQAGAEKAAHLVINGGQNNFSSDIAIGGGNGNTTTAPTPLHSSLTINDGFVKASALAIGHNSGNTVNFNSQPRVTINKGQVQLINFNVAEHRGCEAIVTINGGSVELSGTLQIGHQTTFGGGGVGTVVVNGGSITMPSTLILAANAAATGTLHLCGGEVTAVNVEAKSGYGSILFDGGTLRTSNGPMQDNIDIFILEGGAKVAVNSGRFTYNPPFQQGSANDGGLTKMGAGILALSTTNAHTYTGATLVQEGVLSIRSKIPLPLPAATTLTVAPGAEFHAASEEATAPNTISIAGLTLGTNAQDAPAAGLSLWLDAVSGDSLVINGSPQLGKVVISLYQRGTLLQPALTGEYTLISYTGADPQIDGLSIGNPLPAHNYQFSIDATNKRVVLTVTADAGSEDAIWIEDDSSTWSTGANWRGGNAPINSTGQAVFSDVLSASRTVTLDTAATIGGMTFSSPHSYTIEGSQTLTLQESASAGAITFGKGDHSISTPLRISGGANISLAPNGGTLTLIGTTVAGADSAMALDTSGTLYLSNTLFDSALTINSGTLRLSDATTINGTLRCNSGVVAAIGSATINGAVELSPYDRSIQTSSGATLTINGALLGPGTLLKEGGAGNLTLTSTSNSYSGGSIIKAGTLILQDGAKPGRGNVVMANGVLATAGTIPVSFENAIVLTNSVTVQTDAPLATSGSLIMPEARAITKDGSDLWSIGGKLVGGGTSNTYRVYLRNGTLRFDSGSKFQIGSADSHRSQFDATVGKDNNAIGLVVEPGAEVAFGSLGAQFGTSYNGTFTMLMNGGRLTLTAAENPLGLGDNGKLPMFITINDGEWIATSDSGWCDIGTRSPVDWEMNGGKVSLGRPTLGRMNGAGSGRVGGGMRLTINNGRWEARDFFSWKSTDDNNSTNMVTLNGGCFSIPAARNYHNGGEIVLNLNGGIFEMRGITAFAESNGCALNNYLNGVKSINVLPGGAIFKTIAEQATIVQAFTQGSNGDGGIAKYGSGTLTLAANVTLTGGVTVAEGELVAQCTAKPDLTVNNGGVMNLSKYSGNAIFTSVSGAGVVTNGTLVVEGALSPGDAASTVDVFKAQNLTFADGATLRLDWLPATNDLFEVSGLLTGGNGGFVDFGREEGDDIPVPATITIGYCGNFSGTFHHWKTRNTGYPAKRAIAARIIVQDGVVKLSVMDSGLLILLR